jgi:Kef-type K+ transport system membrane component KefB/mannitol/fructose-specific phosphotransferase system IIA component
MAAPGGPLFTAENITQMFISLGVLLAAARILGELAKRLGQPNILGEILAGILLGPTVLGQLAPELTQWLFPALGPNAVFFQGFTILAVVMFMLVVGMEVDLSLLWKQGRSAISVSFAGILFPFALGFGVAYFYPQFFGSQTGADHFVFALFFATALSISALPVISKTLMDLGLYRTELGMIVVSSAIFNDLFGWIIFALILGMMGVGAPHGLSIWATILFTLAFVAVIFTVGRFLVNRFLPWVHVHITWPGGVLGLAMLLGLFAAGFTEWIGIHAIFGAFMVGVMMGDSPHLRQRTRIVLFEFVSSILAPLFFASIGLRVNFIAHFDGALVLFVILIACLGKVLGCGLGARFSGLPWQESWAIGIGMNARGAMEIILGLLALQYGLIREPMFVALVVMALFTSMVSGPVMQKVLRQKKSKRFYEFISDKTFVPDLKDWSPLESIRTLGKVVAEAAGLPAADVVNAVWEREKLSATGIGNWIATPHAHLPGLSRSWIAVGISDYGIDYDAPDGRNVRIIFLVVSPEENHAAQLEILADIAKTFENTKLRDACLKANNFTEFLALVKTDSPLEA